MVKNVGKMDRIARALLACFLIFLAWAPGVVLSADSTVDYWLTMGLYVAGAYFLITALLGSCLIYRLLDVDSCIHGGTYHSGDDVYDGRGGN